MNVSCNVPPTGLFDDVDWLIKFPASHYIKLKCVRF